MFFFTARDLNPFKIKEKNLSEKCINVDLIENFLNENGLSKTAFCKIFKISPATFAKIIETKKD